MTPAERALLVHRLRDLADNHERCEEDDGAADTADTLVLAMQRDGTLDAELLREAAAALAAAPGAPKPMESANG